MSRQDYIARVRYQNALPPPPCAPKLLHNKVDLTPLLSAGSLSSLVFARPIPVETDQDLSMPIDLINVPRAFESSMFDLPENPELEPEDKELLVDPVATAATAVNGSSAAPNVAFLRRTEYISSAMLREAGARRAQQFQNSTEPADLLRKVELTFDNAHAPLDTLKHPKKKNAKAVKSYDLLPDAKLFDLDVWSLRMVGSAAIRQNKKISVSRDQLEAALFYETTIEDDKWAAFCVPESDEAAQVVELRHDTADSRGAASFKYKKLQDNELEKHKLSKYDEIVINMDDKTALYLPTAGRINLKRQRVEKHREQELRDAEIDELDVEFVDPNPDENIERDNKRSKYDPVTYG